MRRVLALALLLTVLAGCGDASTTVAAASQTYDGPLHLTREEAAHPRAGAAGDVVECDTWGAGGFEDAEVYAEGATADSADAALETAQSEGGGPYGLRPDDLRVAAETDDRVLYVLEVGGEAKQALIVHDGEGTEGAGGDGWYLESWAGCDPVELPASYVDAIGLLVWTDAAGTPVPTTEVETWVGAEHCDWQSMVFLQLGRQTYVREPQPDLRRYFDEEYAAHVPVPEDAVDTGWERDGAHLWISADRERAYVGSPEDAELWPAAAPGLGCD